MRSFRDPNRRVAIAGAIAIGSMLHPAALRGADLLRSVGPSLGLDFRHQDGRTGAKYYIETTGSGGGFLDFDDDGDLDVVLLDGAPPPGVKLARPTSHRLFENRGGRFVDVSQPSGFARSGYGMGVCTGDTDGDGKLDIFVAQYGPDLLFRNLGGGRFEEVAAKAGLADRLWSSSCAFGDIDRDGDLDLFVTHYVDFSFDRNPFCGDRARNLRTYCRPDVFDGVTDSLFVNLGGGTFRDEGAKRGLAQGKTEKGFGVVLTDLDVDGDLDAYVANDGTMNRLYANDGKGRFSDLSVESGTGYNRNGQAESGMGVEAADLDGDGRTDLFVTNYSMETNTWYRNLGDLLFEDVTAASGLGPASWKMVGWGVKAFDLENDGDLDLAVVNGHALDNIEQFESELSYAEPAQLFENDGVGRFREITAQAGADFARRKVARGLAVGDYDDDGRLDLLVTVTNGPAELFRNEAPRGNHWLGLKLEGPRSNRFALGARVEATVGGRTQVREVMSGGSFQSQSDLRVHFGLGKNAGPVSLSIRWPDGKVQRVTQKEIDRYVTIRYSPGGGGGGSTRR